METAGNPLLKQEPCCLIFVLCMQQTVSSIFLLFVELYGLGCPLNSFVRECIKVLHCAPYHLPSIHYGILHVLVSIAKLRITCLVPVLPNIPRGYKVGCEAQEVSGTLIGKNGGMVSSNSNTWSPGV